VLLISVEDDTFESKATINRLNMILFWKKEKALSHNTLCSQTPLVIKNAP
jgi:hypothetical protein